MDRNAWSMQGILASHGRKTPSIGHGFLSVITHQVGAYDLFLPIQTTCASRNC
ncbi:unnamed protein product [Arabidopsis thaliana]|uniref:Uncharacterized protein n=1 Tax=Arabidopsis thaliana TaxID=3702 RepID=A0A654EF61_ARATH|nr:unnamed protein product [Arabidopsis thaliana]